MVSSSSSLSELDILSLGSTRTRRAQQLLITRRITSPHPETIMPGHSARWLFSVLIRSRLPFGPRDQFLLSLVQLVPLIVSSQVYKCSSLSTFAPTRVYSQRLTIRSAGPCWKYQVPRARPLIPTHMLIHFKCVQEHPCVRNRRRLFQVKHIRLVLVAGQRKEG